MAGERTLKITILGDAKSARGAFSDIEKSASGLGDRLKGIFAGVGSAIADMGKIAGGIIVAKLLTDLPGKFMGVVNASSDLVESQNKVNVVFGESAKLVHDFASTAARDLGQSKQQALEAAGTFGNLFTTMGIGQEESANLSTEIVTLASDLASFNNMDPTEVLDKLRAGLVGEAEPLKALGILINDTTVKTKAMEMGLGDANGELTEAEKVQARYSLILEQSNNAQGDFARNSLEYANAQRILSATFQDIAATLGSRLLPLITPLVVAFSQKLPGAADAAFAALDRLTGFLRGPFQYGWDLARDAVLTFIQALQGNWADDGQIRPLHRIFGALGTMIGSVADILQLIKDGDFDEAFRRLSSAAQPMLDVFTELGGRLVDRAFGAVRDIPNRLGDIDWGGIATSILDGITGGFGTTVDVGGRILGWIRDQVAGVDWSEVGSTILSGIGAAISFGQGLGEGALDLGGQIFGWVRDKVSGIDWSEVASSIRSGIGSALSFGGDVVDETIDIGTSIYNWIRDRVVGIDWTEVANSIRSGIGTALTTVQEGAEGAVDIGTSIYNWVNGRVEETDWSGIGTTIQEKISGALDSLAGEDGEGGGGAFAWIQDSAVPALTELARVVQEELGPALDDIKTNFQETGAAFQEGWGPITESVSANVPGISDALMTLAGLLGLLLKTQLELTANMSTAWPAIAMIVTPIVVTIIESIGQMIDVIGTIGRTVMALKDGDWSAAWGEMEGLLGRTKDRIVRIANSMGFDIEAAVGKIAGYIENQKADIEAAVTGIRSAIEAVLNVPNLLYDEGVAIVQGLIDGMGSLLESVRSKAGELASAAKDAVTGALGIQSPSRVFMQIGHDVVAGLAIGLSDSGEATEASKKLAQAIVDQWNLVLGDLPRVVDGSLVQELKEQFRGLNTQLQLALEMGAPAAIIDALRAAQRGVADKLHQIGVALGTDVVQGMIDEFLAGQTAAQVADAWGSIFGRFGDVASGDLQKSLQEQLDTLNKQLDIATRQGAPEAVLDDLRANIAEIEAQLRVLGEVMDDPVIKQEKFWAGFQKQLDRWKEQAIKAGKAIEDQWSGLLDNFGGIIDGSFTESLQKQLQSLNDKLKVALALELPKTIIDGIKEQIRATEQDLIDAGKIMGEAIKAGIEGAITTPILSPGDFVAGRGYYVAPGVFTNAAPNGSSGGGGSRGGGGGSVLQSQDRFMTYDQYKEANVSIELDGNVLTRATSRRLTNNHKFTQSAGATGLL